MTDFIRARPSFLSPPRQFGILFSMSFLVPTGGDNFLHFSHAPFLIFVQVRPSVTHFVCFRPSIHPPGGRFPYSPSRLYIFVCVRACPYVSVRVHPPGENFSHSPSRLRIFDHVRTCPFFLPSVRVRSSFRPYVRLSVFPSDDDNSMHFPQGMN